MKINGYFHVHDIYSRLYGIDTTYRPGCLSSLPLLGHWKLDPGSVLSPPNPFYRIYTVLLFGLWLTGQRRNGYTSKNHKRSKMG